MHSESELDALAEISASDIRAAKALAGKASPLLGRLLAATEPTD
jgi:hypothetical protein